MIEEKIKKLISKSCKELSLPEVDFVIEHPKELGHGDYATNVALVLSKKVEKNPRELAEEFVQYIVQNKLEEVEKVEVAGSGFINFYLSQQFFVDSIKTINDQGVHWGRNETLKGKQVMVEYTDPNPFKEMHIGHLMSNTIGESVARLTEFTGAEVIRANYQGDVGPHVARALYGMQQSGKDTFSPEDLGAAYTEGTRAYEDDESAKGVIDSLNKKIYEKDSSILELYTAGRTISLEHFETIYEKLGTKFDEYYFESMVVDGGLEILKEHQSIFEKSDGAIIFKGEDYGLHTRVFITSKGIPLYEVKELGLAKKKFDDYPDLDVSITITAEEQKEYFKVVRAALSKMYPELEKKIQHITHGFMKLPTGKMSSRTGNVVAAEDLISDVEEKVREKMADRDVPEKEMVALNVAVGALKYTVLKQATGKDIVFDFDKALSFEGDSGPYLQYAHTRAQSILERAQAGGFDVETQKGLDYVTLLEKTLYRFPNVVLRAHKEYEPHYLVTYLTQLASHFNNFYAHERILDADEGREYKLALTRAFQLTIQNGLYLLGIQAPNKM